MAATDHEARLDDVRDHGNGVGIGEEVLRDRLVRGLHHLVQHPHGIARARVLRLARMQQRDGEGAQDQQEDSGKMAHGVSPGRATALR